MGSGWDPREKGIVFASLVAQLRDAARVLGSWSPARRKEGGIGDDGRFITTDVEAEQEELAELGVPVRPPSPSPEKINRI